MTCKESGQVVNPTHLQQGGSPAGDDLASRMCYALYTVCDCEVMARKKGNNQLEQSLADIREAIMLCLRDPDLQPVNSNKPQQ